MSLRYASSKLSDAVIKLAIGPEEIRVRLIDGYYSIIAVSPNELPEPYRSDLEWAKSKILEGGPLMRDGVRKARLSHIRKSTGVKIATKIINVASFLEDYSLIRYNQRGLRVVACFSSVVLSKLIRPRSARPTTAYACSSRQQIRKPLFGTKNSDCDWLTNVGNPAPSCHSRFHNEDFWEPVGEDHQTIEKFSAYLFAWQGVTERA